MANDITINLPIITLSTRTYNGSAPDCVVVNTKSFAVTEYLNYGFNSYARFNGANLIADQNGIYEQDTTSLDDNAYSIKSSIKSGIIDTVNGKAQRLRNAWINYESNGNIQLTTKADETITRQYTILYNPDIDGIREGRIKFERGIKDRVFDFKLSNVNGSDIELDSITITMEPIISSKE